MVDSSDDSIPNASASTVRVEIPSPFYLHPSENASSSLLPAVFDGTGYRSWRRAVLRALSVKSKTGFINGKVVRPDPTDPSFQQWERCDDMVTSWILNSLSPDLRDSLQYVNNAQELWVELEERYDQTNGFRGNILMMNTLPSMAQAFAILSQEEKQREVKPYNHTALDSTSLNAYGQNPSRGFKTNYSPSRGGSAANVCAPDMNGVQSKEESEVRRQMPLNLSKDQYEQLLNLLGTLQVGNGASNSDNSNSMLNGAVNLAGMMMNSYGMLD
uniref:Retrotransposon Copia-like N-terminal domain-containing protein n=1 Tax=Solanum tuberosum TaxID=4113 RepID=M1AGH8_SOLTU